MTRTVSATREEQKETVILNPNSANAAQVTHPTLALPAELSDRRGSQHMIRRAGRRGGDSDASWHHARTRPIPWQRHCQHPIQNLDTEP
eukprot:455845-Hanusia_phi.AAC.1